MAGLHGTGAELSLISQDAQAPLKPIDSQLKNPFPSPYSTIFELLSTQCFHICQTYTNLEFER